VLSPAGDPDHHVGTEETVRRADLPWAFARSEKLGRAPGSQHGSEEGDSDRADGPLGSVLPAGGNTTEALRSAKLILWKGYCSVHARFSVEQIAAARADYPGINIIVHPECRMEAVQAADCDG
jgi:quinolinate synthase